MKTLSFVLCLAFSVACLASPEPKPDPATAAPPATKPTPAKPKIDELLDHVQVAWKDVKTYQSPFHQTVRSKALKTEEKAAGTLTLMKPDRFRWESTTDGTLQIISGNRLTQVQPKAQRDKNVVDIYKDVSKRFDPRLLQLLAGTIDLREHYKPRLGKQSKKTQEIVLAPKRKGEETYIAEIDRESYLLVALAFETEDTRTRLELTKPVINTDLDAKLFEYAVSSNDIVHYQ